MGSHGLRTEIKKFRKQHSTLNRLEGKILIANSMTLDKKGKVSSEGDILSVAALANAYATCHNVQDLLYLRGFTSKSTHVKRGKKGKKEEEINLFHQSTSILSSK